MTKAKTKVTTTTQTTRDHVIEVPGSLIVELLIGAGYKVDRQAEVYVCVPGGGDWSNTSLDVDDTCPVKVRWKTNDVETTEV